ncbi:MAG: tripartite tricarboxylate transporter substrate binding protein [Chloroflexota bacterium]
MKRFALVLASATVILGLAAGCSQPAAAPTPAPIKATEPPKAAAPAPAQPTAAAAQPTAAPKANWPEKGKTISIIVPFAAGGTTDIGARILAPLMEKELGVPVQVVNKAGAGGQLGLTELVRAKPDGYTIGSSNLPSTPTVYLDPDRKATFTRKDLLPIANVAVDPGAIGVKADSPIKSVKDLIDRAKANPEQLKLSTAGLLTSNHIELLAFQQVTGVKFSPVHMDGDGPATTALLGGHVDFMMAQVGSFLPHVKSGNVRALAVMDSKESKFLTGVPTLESQGVKLYADSSRGFSAPAGTPKEVITILAAAMKKAAESPEYQTKMDEQGVYATYMAPDEYAKYYDDYESRIKPLVDNFKKSK